MSDTTGETAAGPVLALVRVISAHMVGFDGDLDDEIVDAGREVLALGQAHALAAAVLVALAILAEATAHGIPREQLWASVCARLAAGAGNG